VGGVLLPAGSSRPLPGPPRWLVAKDAFSLAQPEAAQALYQPLAESMPAVGGLWKWLRRSARCAGAALGQGP
jgi:hypothetical protein